MRISGADLPEPLLNALRDVRLVVLRRSRRLYGAIGQSTWFAGTGAPLLHRLLPARRENRKTRQRAVRAGKV